MRRRVAGVLVPIFLAVLPTMARAQGTVTGRVTDAGTGTPIADARVLIVGTTIGAPTTADGRYTLRNVPAGQAEVRVLRIGYGEQKKPVAIVAGQSVTVDFAIQPVAISLAPMVVTATGETRRVELGNSIPQINAEERTKTQPISNVSDLLTAQAPGVQVLPSNMTGTASRIRIRGISSISLSSDPIYVIDGIRMTSASGGATTLSTGGSIVSRVNDINPDDIENIEVVKGPSAATLYGTDAANGVIVITTKKGRAGAQRWSARAEFGTIDQKVNDFPTAYSLWGRRGAGSSQPNCSVTSIVSGACVQDSLTSFNLFNDPETTPFGIGHRQSYGLSVSGGPEALRYYASIDFEEQADAFKLPEFDEARMKANNEAIRPDMRHPNALQRTSVRLNVNGAPSSQLDLGVTMAFVQTDQRLPQSDNNTFGVFSHAYRGLGFKDTTMAGARSRSFSGTTPLYGYRAMTPGEVYRIQYHTGATRVITGANLNYRPLSWLSARGNFGVDYTGSVDQSLCRRADCIGNTTRLLGFANNNTVRFYNYSADVGVTGTFNPFAWLNSKTTLGTQYVNSQTLQNFAGGQQLPVGATTVSAAAIPASGEATGLSKTLGAFVEEAVAIRDRLFLTGAVRTDQNSAFGTNFQRVYYPKASVSWVISEEPFFPALGWLNQFRLRSAYGASGVQPGPNDALQTFAAGSINADRIDQPALFTGAPGNANLKPERATEYEGGFEARLFSSRLTFDVGYYNKLTKDALLSEILIPSAGVGNRIRRVNIASVKNVGWEGLVTAVPVHGDRLGWDVSLNGSLNTNKIVSMGSVAPQVATTYRNTAGYPILGYWEKGYTYADADNNGVITKGEIQVDTAASFQGYAVPRYELALTNGLDFLDRKVRLQALIDYKGGYKIENVTEEFRCLQGNCRAVNDKTAPLWEQARAVAMRELTATDPNRAQRQTYAGYIEDGSFIRFRELSLSFTPEEAFAAKYLKARSATFSLAVRNLGFLKKNYSGVDPEMNYGNSNIANEFQTSPTPRVVTFRVNVGF